MKTRLLTVAVTLCLCVAPAMADMVTFGPAGPSQLQEVFDTRTLGPNPGDSQIDVVNDAINGDAYWDNTGLGAVTTMIVELAGFKEANTFGIYEYGDPSNKVEVFSGADTDGHSHTVNMYANGDIYLGDWDGTPDGHFNHTLVFGYYLDSTLGYGMGGGLNDGGGLFYSDRLLNTDGQVDHMFSYAGQGDKFDMPGLLPDIDPMSAFYHVLAWEDLAFPGADGNYTDMVVLVESVAPVPVPAAVLLAFLGLGAAGLKLRRFA